VTTENAKWCRGPAHEQPAFLPDTEEFFYFYKSGPRQGFSHSWCKACYRWNGMYDSQMIDCSKILSFVGELVLRCGSRENAARYASIGVSTIYKVTSYGQCSVQVPTAKKLLLALDRKRREDRAAGHTPQAYREHRISVARAEERLNLLPPPSHFYEE